MAWIVRADADAARRDDICAHLWDLGTSGIAEVDGAMIAAFDSRDAAETAAAVVDGTVESATMAPDAVRTEPALVHVAGHTVRLRHDLVFGHGSHPTTRLMLDTLATVPLQGARVLDVGTGTGVLAIVAALAGARRVVALDIDQRAIGTARHNVIDSGVANRVDVSARLIRDLTSDPFDLVVANLLLPAQLAVASDVERLTAPNGCAYLTGVLADQIDQVAAMYAGEICVLDVVDGWALLRIGHRVDAIPS